MHDGTDWEEGAKGERTSLPLPVELKLREPVRGVASLHLYGEKDTTVPPAMSVELAASFAEPAAETLVHGKGHIMPQKAAECAEVIDFLERAL